MLPLTGRHKRAFAHPRLAVAVALVVVLGGCIGGSDAPGATPSEDLNNGGDPTASTEPSDDVPRYTFPGEEAATVRRMNGSFAPHEACFPASCFTSLVTGDTPHQQVLDLTDDVPPGTPTWVRADLSWEQTVPLAEVGSTVDIFLRTGDARVLSSDVSQDPTTQTGRLEALVLRQANGTVGIVVQYQFVDPDPEVTYTLQADVTADPALVPADIPVAFPHPGDGTGVRFTPADGEGTVRLMLWGPDDGFVGHVEMDGSGGDEVALDAGSGDYVAFVIEPDAGVHATHVGASEPPADAARLRVLETEVREGPAHEMPTTDEVTWSFEPERVPLGVGMWVAGTDAFSVRVEVRGEIRSPNGTVFTWPSETLRGGEFQFVSLASGNLAAGPYEAVYATSAQVNGEVGEIVVHYVR